MRKSAALLALLLVSCGSESGSPDLKVSNAWARATAPGQSTAAAYATITNEGTAADQLTGVTTPAGQASIHSTTMDGGVMRMRPVEEVEIGPGETVAMKPAGNHIMIAKLNRPLGSGEKLPLRLRFARSGEMAVEAEVRSTAPAEQRM